MVLGPLQVNVISLPYGFPLPYRDYVSVAVWPITSRNGQRMHALRARQGGAATRAYSTIESVFHTGRLGRLDRLKRLKTNFYAGVCGPASHYVILLLHQ